MNKRELQSLIRLNSINRTDYRPNSFTNFKGKRDASEECLLGLSGTDPRAFFDAALTNKNHITSDRSKKLKQAR